MAPVFETVSWVTWQLAGQKLSHAPLAFTLMSYTLSGNFMRPWRYIEDCRRS